MFCPKCGTKIPDGSTVCPECKTDYSSIINARAKKKATASAKKSADSRSARSEFSNASSSAFSRASNGVTNSAVHDVNHDANNDRQTAPNSEAESPHAQNVQSFGAGSTYTQNAQRAEAGSTFSQNAQRVEARPEPDPNGYRSARQQPYDLEAALVKADRICNEAYPFMEKASNMRANADEKAVKSRKICKIISIVIGLFSIDAMGNLAANTGADPSMAFLIVIMGILLAVAFYKLVFLKNIVDLGVKSEYETAANEEQKGTDILNANADALSVIPSDYWYPLATDYVLKMIRSGRADSVNEALLMFDEQLHRWRMEDSSASILAQQQAQTEALNGIRKSNAINATANVVNAAANITRLFK